MSFKPNFVATLPASASSTTDPVQARRNALLVRLEDQKALAKNPEHKRTYKIRAKDEHGKIVYQTGEANIRPSWRDGTFYVRIGNGTLLDLAKGMAGIAFKSQDELVQSIEWVAGQVSAGTYDKQLEAAAAKSRARLQNKKKSKAA